LGLIRVGTSAECPAWNVLPACFLELLGYGSSGLVILYCNYYNEYLFDPATKAMLSEVWCAVACFLPAGVSQGMATRQEEVSKL
jgi:hypothetical protein